MLQEHKELIDYGHKEGILNICQNLHMFNTGSFDELSKFDYEMGLKYLKWKLANWSDGLPKTKVYDYAVYKLIEATIVDCEVNKYRYK